MTISIASNDSYAVLEALQAMLKAFPALISIDGGNRVDLGEEVNVDPDKAPWIGLYSIKAQYPIRTLGMGNGFRSQREGIAVVVQNVSRTSGKECRKQLGVLQKAVIDCILTDTSIGGTMDVVDDFQVSYATVANQGKQVSFQSAVITFTAVKLVGVSGG
jgi:hypothetical protein